MPYTRAIGVSGVYEVVRRLRHEGDYANPSSNVNPQDIEDNLDTSAALVDACERMAGMAPVFVPGRRRAEKRSRAGRMIAYMTADAAGLDAGHAIEWDLLREAATDAMKRAYVPYSRFPVGAAALVDDGRVIAGCNVENASYGLTLCAECALVSALHMTGGGRLVAFTCVDGNGGILMPCGRCRQLLYEHSTAGMLLETVSGIRTIDEVLPDAFGPRQLEEFGATKDASTQ